MRKVALVRLLPVTLLILAACTSPAITPPAETVIVPGPTQVVTATPTATLPPGPSRLVICQDTAPESLYLYGGSRAARHILEAVYDGPIDNRSYGFQPVILEKLPSLDDGDAYFSPVLVQPGDTVVDINGVPIELSDGVQVFPSHTCMDAANPACVVTFVGTSTLQMEQLVVSWQILPDITWSDGTPLTADDSVYSYELACHPDTPSSKYLCDRTASYAAAGQRTVVWTGLPGYVDDLYFANFFSPLPKHLWQDQLRYSPSSLLTRRESSREPLGWGPYVIREWVQGDHVLLEPNPLYFRAAEGLPRVDELVFRFAPSTERLVTMVLAGECDIGLAESDLTPLLPVLIAARDQGLLNLVTSSSAIWENLSFGIASLAGGNRPNLFADVRVRQAIAHCIDRQTIVDDVTFGLGRVADDYIAPEHPLYAGERLTRWPYDPHAGEALLAEAGWADENGDGVLEAVDVEEVRDGTPFRFTLLLAQDNSNEETAARIIRSNLADCGIQVDLQYVPVWEFFADGPNGPLFGRQFDAALFAWHNDVEPPCNLYLSDQIPQQGRWGLPNATGFSNGEYDAACHAAQAALPGTFEYTSQHIEAQRIFAQQLPALPLYWHIRLALAQPHVDGFTLDAAEDSELWNIEGIGIAP